MLWVLIRKLILTLQNTLCTYVTRALLFHPSVCLRVGMLSNIKRIVNITHCNIYTLLCHLYMKTVSYRIIKKKSVWCFYVIWFKNFTLKHRKPLTCVCSSSRTTIKICVIFLFLNPEDRTHRLSRTIGMKVSLLAA